MALNLYSEARLLSELGQRLKDHRLRRNMLQKDLAAKAGISVSALKKLENDGKATLENFMKVVFALRLEKEMSGLFVAPALSIAQVEALKQPTRQRATQRKRKEP
ncbi:helix-turn-helix domain-containing protein [Pantoea sp. At-9b]|uniref:helix-turn-helix domain-containing protein n=1 Tax=Pantoea sp. (strain At-9b) TaxID=592316 RepID=UPI0001B3FAF3|nr:helix-turn-helix transcriptional regulator [Pantoea sp. At-9b]ADU72238.1 transcriptional regulator, XRE family [Pantoea sp. At-9b]